MGILTLILTVFFIVWLLGVLLVHDFQVPPLNLNRFKKVLVVFPHPDDEVLTVGGLIGLFKNQGIHTTLITLTKGERGTPNATLQEKLKATRRKELLKATKILGFNKVILEDFGDGQLEKKQKVIAKYLTHKINKLNPDAIITYDLSGLYGHPDHISVPKVLKPILNKKYPNIRLIFVTNNKKIMRFIKLPTHMAKNEQFIKHQTVPTHRVFIGHHLIGKVRALYAHQSQLTGFRKALPLFLPLWFFVSLSVIEYFHEVQS